MSSTTVNATIPVKETKAHRQSWNVRNLPFMQGPNSRNNADIDMEQMHKELRALRTDVTRISDELHRLRGTQGTASANTKSVPIRTDVAHAGPNPLETQIEQETAVCEVAPKRTPFYRSKRGIIVIALVIVVCTSVAVGVGVGVTAQGGTQSVDVKSAVSMTDVATSRFFTLVSTTIQSPAVSQFQTTGPAATSTGTANSSSGTSSTSV